MARALEWDRRHGATYAWVLGLHYYADTDDDGWQPTCMLFDADIWNGEHCSTRDEAEAKMQAHFDAEIARWAS